MKNDNQQNLNTLSKRREYFNQLFPKIKGCDYRKDITFNLPNTCPSCGYFSLEARCSWEICSICFWEDDGQDNHDADKIFGGPNGDYSLTKYRVEISDYLEELKKMDSQKESDDYKIGNHLNLLDDLKNNFETNAEIVKSHIETITHLINNIRFKASR